jgi:signal transduction histidine kinase
MSIIAYKPDRMSQISHELRIPLTGIMGMAYFLNKTPLTSEQKKYIRIIEREAKRLLGLENKLHILVKEGINE